MTVGEFVSDAERQAAALPDYEPITFQAERLHLVYGPIDRALPWIVSDVIPLKAQG
jgi:hypothetical protein